MTTPGFFELYPDARPALPAGRYTTTSHQDLTAAPPTGTDGHIAVDDTQFHLHIDSPRYTMPPDQILSTFPPAGAQGDWRERLPQIVLKRRTLPWERNPGPFTDPPPVGPPPPDPDPAVAPPWLALVVLAEGEGQLSAEVDVSQCVTPGLSLGDDADVPQGKYLEVSQDIIDKVFPCLDELALLSHVRKVDLRDTELALGDDDGYLAVVLSSRLPQPGPPATPDGDPTPLKYTAYLINLEQQLPRLLPTEPAPAFSFDAVNVEVLVNAELLAPAPNATVDQIAMNLAPGIGQLSRHQAIAATARPTEPAPFAPAPKLETAAASWSTGPAGIAAQSSSDLRVATDYKFGVQGSAIGVFTQQRYRFPVLVAWEFSCIGTGGFERLMNKLDVGLLGTLDAAQPPPVPEVAATGHVALPHRSRRGEPARSWYRGPLGPQPTQRVLPSGGVLPLAHTGDQLRRVVPDGREDVSLAAMFEIGRLLTLSKPALVASLMAWRRDLFGAARARELADLLAAGLFDKFGETAIGGRNALEGLIRSTVVSAFTGIAPDALAPKAQLVTAPRLPDELAGLGPEQVYTGLSVDPRLARRTIEQFGVDGLGRLPVAVSQAPTTPVSGDKTAMVRLQARLAQRVDALTASALKTETLVAAPVDTLDELLAEAAATVESRGEG
jgi:hypothetical protein